MMIDEIISIKKLKSFMIIIILILFFFLCNKLLKSNNIPQINKNIFLEMNESQNSIESYTKYFNICKNLIRLNNSKTHIHKYPFISVCIPVYNTEKYIERAVLSIINQSFQNFEIIIVNDNSNDNTSNIIKRLQKEDNRIRIINHLKNSGVYNSRVEAALNSNGKYILFLDPDDTILRQNLFECLYNYNINYNLDIIEFLVYFKKENKTHIYYPNNTNLNHNHSYNNNIIYQPLLSDIIFYVPNTKKNKLICRTIWNKLFRRELLLKTIKYVGEEYYFNDNLIVADDTILNIINFHFAKNYSNIKIGGYLYNLRAKSMSRGFISNLYIKKKAISFFFYIKLLYRYIKEFDKDRNLIYKELFTFRRMIIAFKKYNIKIYYFEKLKLVLYEIKNDDKSSHLLKDFIHKLLMDLN